MKHAAKESLDRLNPLLVQIRQVTGLKERSPGVFYRRSSAFLHFHEDPSGLYADLRTGPDWLRFPVNTAAERRALLSEIKSALSASRDRRG